MLSNNINDRSYTSEVSVQSERLAPVSKNEPCRHCGKPDWCYRIGELEVCKRSQVASGWELTTKADKDGDAYLTQTETKQTRVKSRKEYFYNDRSGAPLVKVARTDDGAGKKAFYQSHWDGQKWANSNPDHIKAQIPIYRYDEVRDAIEAGEPIFVVEGEEVADLLWNNNLAATTFIGGAGKYRKYGNYKEDLAGARIILCPDRDEPGVAHMDEVYQDFPDTQWLYAPPKAFYWEHLPKSQGLDVGDWILQDGASAADIMNSIGDKKHTSTKNSLCTKSIVNVDNSELSSELSTPQSDDETVIQSIVNIVNAILDANFNEILERKKLNDTYTKYKDSIDRKLFDSIVASERVKFNEVLPEDEIKLKSLMNFTQVKINWDDVLPAPLARDIKHDADVLNIDPVMIWQALLPAVSSLAGGIVLNEYGGVPCLNWTCTVLPSGGGKTRADSLVFAPLRQMQHESDDTYKEALRQYKRDFAGYEKSEEENKKEPEKPVLRQYIMEIATIQGVTRRLSEQGEGKGSLWARDEIKGIFSSLNQFSGDSEAQEILLKLWDKVRGYVIRADFDNSYSYDGALSLTGGIQNDVFRTVFRDAKDANGMQARFLFACPESRKKRYTQGYCNLSDRLPVLYKWLNELGTETVRLSPKAQKYFAHLVSEIGDQIEQVSHAGIRTWMNKLDTHVLRIALALHLIECFYAPSNTNIKELSLDTLKRAVSFAQYYRSAFHILQEKVSVSDDIASIMLQIHTAALAKHPDGISARDVYRNENARAIQARAKSAGREAGAYVVDLFEKMAQMGYGEVIRKGKTVRFIAKQNLILEKVSKGVDNDDNSYKTGLEPLQNQEKDCQQKVLTIKIVLRYGQR